MKLPAKMESVFHGNTSVMGTMTVMTAPTRKTVLNLLSVNQMKCNATTRNAFSRFICVMETTIVVMAQMRGAAVTIFQDLLAEWENISAALETSVSQKVSTVTESLTARTNLMKLDAHHQPSRNRLLKLSMPWKGRLSTSLVGQ